MEGAYHAGAVYPRGGPVGPQASRPAPPRRGGHAPSMTRDRNRGACVGGGGGCRLLQCGADVNVKSAAGKSPSFKGMRPLHAVVEKAPEEVRRRGGGARAGRARRMRAGARRAGLRGVWCAAAELGLRLR